MTLLSVNEELALAISLAAQGHIYQRDKGGKPYILHPIKVMHYLKTTDMQLMAIAIMHDQDFVRLHSMKMPQAFHSFCGNENAVSLIEKLLILDTIKMEVYRKELREAVVIEGGMPKGPYVAMSIDATKFMPEYAIEQLLARQFIPHLVREIKRHLNDKTS